MSKLALVRRLEAIGFRAWPAASNHYDGTWLIRQTAGHASKRLNSVNPLDPSDYRDIEARIDNASRRFKSYDRSLVFRQTPLTPITLENYFDVQGWERFDETCVMMADISALNLDKAVDLLPVKDIGWYVEASIKTHGHDEAIKAGLTEVVGAIIPKHGFFVGEKQGFGPVVTVLCVVDDGLAGIFDLSTHRDFRKLGYGRSMLLSAILWARYSGAEKVWLQVERKNKAAITLYEAEGFKEVYHYCYRQQPKAQAR